MMKSQSTNWKGNIPVTLSLAPSSLSSPVMPSPVHCMVSRQTYLHLALEDEIRMFHEFAPMVANFIKSVEQSASDDIDDSGNHDDVGKVKRESIEGKTDNNVSTSTKSSYPKCWFEDEDTGTPLRWHLFAGLLYDLLKLRKIKTSNDAKMSSLPWKIRVHYTSYPHTILPLDDDIPQIIFQNYLNSLKQALYIQHNSNRVVNKMTKQNHIQLWDGIKRCKFDVYNEISLWLNRGNGSGGGEEKNDSEDNITLEHVPIKVLIDGKPSFARPCKQYKENGSLVTIGDVLYEWLPNLFPFTSDENNNAKNNIICSWCIQGINVPVDTPVSDLWKALSHPDRFLYITVVSPI